jgi:CubicO group peptidase (beta-lactamase class C family)
MIIRLLAALLLLLPLPALAQALTPAETLAIDQLVAKSLADTGVPSASIAVVRGGRVVLAKAYGKQSEANRPPDARALYQIASISKQFTAAALLLLEDEGRLSLNDTVGRYVPGITGGDRITLRQLLDHTSGLQDYWPQDFSFPAMANPVTPQQILDRWAKKPLDFEPGTQWQYSNTGYVAAGLVVERVAGMPLLDFLQARIFRPLGIRAIDQDLAVGPGFPQGYKRFALGPVRPETPAAHGWLYAAGELAMSAEDLAKWNIARLDRAILPADDWAAQETATRLADGSSTGYGLGVVIGTQNGRRFVEHGGEAVGFLSESIVFPDDRASIVVLTNSWSGDAYLRIARGIGTVILPPPPVSAADARALARVRTVYNQLRNGRVDPALLTENARYFFTPVALADHRTSLSPLGTPTAIVQTGATRLRGGFELRAFRVTLPSGALTISTFADPASGRIEQYIVSGAQR